MIVARCALAGLLLAAGAAAAAENPVRAWRVAHERELDGSEFSESGPHGHSVINLASSLSSSARGGSLSTKSRRAL